jgi:hypothetical protein
VNLQCLGRWPTVQLELDNGPITIGTVPIVIGRGSNRNWKIEKLKSNRPKTKKKIKNIKKGLKEKTHIII